MLTCEASLKLSKVEFIAFEFYVFVMLFFFIFLKDCKLMQMIFFFL